VTDLIEAAVPGTISAYDIADALGLPRPTDQQRLVIESELSPALVVAGAGSGKTETMASRVLWLVANGKVRPREILGLTFTRKAAGELSLRIRERIAQLAEHGLLPVSEDSPNDRATNRDAPEVDAPGAIAGDEFDKPTVATYNSFANLIYRDNAILIGRESDGAVLGEASAWQLARSLVVASSDDRLPGLGKSVDTITKAVLELSHAVSENIADPFEVRAYAARFAAVAELPAGGTGAYAEVATLAATVGNLDVLLDLAEAFQQAKLERGFVEYSDQVALALRIVRTIPRVREEFRNQYKVVLLDEYQDTSVVQTWLLSELFADHAVMAVGDPNQSIYGWRGASAANLEQFANQFGGGVIAGFNLTTSWRNGHGILAVANTLVEPLVGETRVRVDKLQAGPTATALPVDIVIDESLLGEAATAAAWLKARLATIDPKTGQPPTAAMLFRARKTQSVFIDALRDAEIPFHVLGIGGLLAEPEIADLVSALRVAGDPTAGNDLVRLLAGSRWRIGPRDLTALRQVSSWLIKRDYAQRPLDPGVNEALRNSVAEGEGGSIIDALDFVATARPGHSELARFSEVGLERLREAGQVFARIRARSGLDLLDFVTFVEQELQLDIEVLANEFRQGGVANREAFFDALTGYLAVVDFPHLSGFLGWLREAEWRDNLAPRPEQAEPGTVQLLTVHGSKGLEWDVVVVPRFVEDELPSKLREGSSGWLSFGALPWPFRGDSSELPDLEWRTVETRKEFLEAKKDFGEKVVSRHVLEERRLAYVAVTRARHSLLLTGSFWATQASPRRPSPFLRELEAAGVIGALPEASEFDENPNPGDGELFTWPLDPLGNRRSRVVAAAELVREGELTSAGRWQGELDLLLAERVARLSAAEVVELPTRVPASRFKDFVTDAATVASSLRRPMPERPYRATRLGTLFHSWVEERYGADGASEELDASLTELDLGESVGGQDTAADEAELARLKSTFEHSPWATRKPVEVEREIHLVLDGQVIVCKIDAVYSGDDGRFEVVDWKTGKAPKSAADLEAKQLQLALYRLAYAQWKGIDPQLIDAVFYFVSDDRVITPERLFDEDELVDLWRSSLRPDRGDGLVV